MTRTDNVERELKLGAWPEFVLPDLTGVAEGISAGAATTRELDAVYYDTRDLHLLRRGATLRFRRGEPPGDVWTAKLPSDGAAEGLARREITVRGRRDSIPREFADLMRGWALGLRLNPVARIRTRRRSVALCDGAGRTVATLDDDAVTVLRGRRVVARFRELEVELVGDAPPELLTAVDERLHAAGAERVPQIPKVGRALGRLATLPWQLARPELSAKPSLAAAAHAELVAMSAQLADLHAPLVLETRTMADGARGAARRLRHAIDALGPLFDPPLAPTLGAQLDWLAGELARVADPAAVLERIDEADPALGRAGLLGLEERGEAALARARGRLLRRLRERRYEQLLGQLARLAAAPPAPSRLGKRRVAAAGPKFARAAWRPLRDAASADAELLEPVAGRLEAALRAVAAGAAGRGEDSRRQVERLVALTAEHDKSLAIAGRIRTLARRGEPDVLWVGGVVAGRELALAETLAAWVREAWEAAAEKTAWSWTE